VASNALGYTALGQPHRAMEGSDPIPTLMKKFIVEWRNALEPALAILSGPAKSN